MKLANCQIFWVIFGISLLQIVSTLPVPKGQNSPSEKVDPIKYLVTFGWLESNSQNPRSKEVLEALKKFQSFAGLNETGQFDEATLGIMTLPRCGEIDTDDLDAEVEQIDRNQKSGVLKRKKRYVLQGTRWKSRELTYNISKYTKDMEQEKVDTIIASAFRQWENVANISFFRVREGKIHIDIRFESKYHGDDETFDGPGGTTAHAYFPVFGGNIHFDDDEDWTHDSDWGVNLFQVATHEIGHALGLEHSNVQGFGSVMSPFYTTFRKDFSLFIDDIDAIQMLYGKRVLTICDDSKVDAAATMSDGNSYIFKGNFVYRIKNADKIADEPPQAIEVAFPGLPSNLDAAITRHNGISYFFKGEEFWRVSNMSVDIGFPKKISDFFPGIPTPIDAAFVFSVDENIYFFKGSQYWKFDHRQKPPVPLEFPKFIYNWPGIPQNGLDAAVSLSDEYGNKFTYFFKGNQYWKFNDKSFSIYLSNPAYPKLISRNLFGCRM